MSLVADYGSSDDDNSVDTQDSVDDGSHNDRGINRSIS